MTVTQTDKYAASAPGRQALAIHPEMVLIDLDGTLVDTAPDLAYAVDLMMESLELPRRGERAVREWIGNGVPVLVRRALVGAYDGEADETLYDKAYPLFLDLYEKNVCVHSRLYPGARIALEYLKGAGYRLGCVTNKPARYTEPLLNALGVYEYFDIVVSGDTLDKKKPDPAPLIYAAEQLHTSPRLSLMAGDSVNDVEAARAAGFQVVCVNYGYNHGRDIQESKPDAVIDSLADLKSLLTPSDS
jgi:phosphoglycolate phosphatase